MNARAMSGRATTGRRLIRQALTIARRDFVATVFTPTFLMFLFAPAIMASFGAIGGLGAATVGRSAEDRVRVVALVADDDAEAMVTADRRLRRVFRDGEAPPALLIHPPTDDPAAAARLLATAPGFDPVAILYAPLDRPHLLVAPAGRRAADYLLELARQTRSAHRGELAGADAVEAPLARARPARGGRDQSAFFTVFALFFLTLLLAGQAVGTMAEERGNKVIEVLAAAVPLEAVFFGKLLGMFGVAVLFVGFWGTLFSQIGWLLPAGAATGLAALSPAVGIPAFIGLFLAYFTLAYLLLGAVFLGVGAQASTMREIQMLSLPITIVQVAMFGLASAAASRPGSAIAMFAEIFPLSSPFAMAARAAQTPGLLVHVAALAWQLIWVAIVIALGARAFRRGVLQSGSNWWPRRRRTMHG